MSLNPYESADESANEEASALSLSRYIVRGQDYGSNTLQLEPFKSKTQSAEESNVQSNISALVPQVGDAPNFENGEIVIVGFLASSLPVVLGTDSIEVDIPDQSEGERVLGHNASDSLIRIKANGNVVIDAEATLELGGEGGAKVARKGDAISTDGPDSTTGEITGGSDTVNAVD